MYLDVPRIFYQLYMVYVIVQDLIFPLVYVICSRKDEATYTAIFQHVKESSQELGTEISPEYVMMDFELSGMNAVCAIFPNSVIKGCLFHFSQSIWRNVINQGLKQQYDENEHIRKDIRKLLALPFIPLHDLEETFDNLLDTIHDDVQDVATYMETTYIRDRPARGRRRAIPPRFVPQIWNMYDLILNGIQRTNRYVEG